MFRLSPEIRLLLTGVAPSSNEEDLSRIRELAKLNLSWEAVLQNAIRHHLAPLLYHNLSEFNEDGLFPQDFMEKLKKVYYRNIARNRIIYEDLTQILKIFKENDISAIVLKGFSLAMAYPHFLLRPMSDIDLLVKSEDEKKARRIRWMLKRKDTIQTGFEIATNHHDLSMDGIYDIDIQRIWRDALSAKIGDADVLVMPPEDILLSICVSCCRKGFQFLRFFCDARMVIEHYQIDWRKLIDTVKRCQMEIPFFTLLFLTQELFRCAVPAYAIQELHPSAIRFRIIMWLFRRQLATLQNGGVTALGNLESLNKHILSYATNNKKVLIKELTRILFPQAHWMKKYYYTHNRWMAYLGYLIHPLVVIIMFFRALKESFFPQKVQVPEKDQEKFN